MKSHDPKKEKIRRPKSLIFRPYRENSRPSAEKIFKKPFIYKLSKNEIVDVLMWQRWPTYDFIFGIPNKKCKKELREKEKGFFQYRSVKDKKVICGFWIDGNELNLLIRGFRRIKDAQTKS